MKFLIDAQLPRRFCSWLVAAGHDATHTLDLPPKLLLVATGNIGNAQLEKLIRANLAMIAEAFEAYRFIELGSETLVIHE